MILGRQQLRGQGSSPGSQSGGETGGQRERLRDGGAGGGGGGTEGGERQREMVGRGRQDPAGRTRRSGGGDGSATPQLDNHLLAVVAGAPVACLLQGSGCLGQQHRPLARGGEEGEGKVAAGQQDGGGPLSLAGPGVQLSCGNEEGHVGLRAESPPGYRCYSEGFTWTHLFSHHTS